MSNIATFKTSKGTFKAELYTDKMPITCGNFIDLANSGFYDGIVSSIICWFAKNDMMMT